MILKLTNLTQSYRYTKSYKQFKKDFGFSRFTLVPTQAFIYTEVYT
jgi:hypothetical protein